MAPCMYLNMYGSAWAGVPALLRLPYTAAHAAGSACCSTRAGLLCRKADSGSSAWRHFPVAAAACSSVQLLSQTRQVSKLSLRWAVGAGQPVRP